MGFESKRDILQVIADRSDVNRMRIQSPVFNAQEEEDLPYLGADNQVHLMDLYRPVSYTAALPVILDVHGGGWYRGDKKINRNYGMFLASKGYAVLSINYTLAENNDLRSQVIDILHAVQWMQTHAKEYDFDLNRFYVCADSAGAHLSLLAYIVDRTEGLRQVYDVKNVGQDVCAFGLVCPVTDLHFIMDFPILPPQRKITIGLLGDQYRENPLRYCTSISDVLRTSTFLPPVYFVSSEQDAFKSQSMKLHHVLTRRNVEHQFRFLPSGKDYPLQHSFPVLYPEYSESIAVNQEMLRFFETKIK